MIKRYFGLVDALVSIKSGASWHIHGEEIYDNLVWKDTSLPCPTKEQIEEEIIKLQAEYDAKQYQRDRAEEYPTMQEQLDMQYWDAINNTTTWQDAINAVKAKYPKPTES
jgi:hypothetical protein